MTKNNEITIAVDGPAGSGKSSVCRNAAIDLGIKYIDSGALYRCITFYFLEKYNNTDDVKNIEQGLQDLAIVQNFNAEGNVEVFVNNKDVSRDIRDEKITKNIGFFSDKVVIREFVNSLLRDWSKKESIIMDGRDIGSVVFPHADIKIYLDASVDIRTTRRVKDYIEMGKNVDEKSIRNQIIQRDFEDMNREVGALVRVDDAVYIDTSNMSFQAVTDLLKQKITDIK